MKYRKKALIVEAEQWFKVTYDKEAIYHLDVGYFRDPSLSGKRECKYCGHIMHNHGWIETLEGGHIVCPSDWIITGTKGEKYPCKDNIFKEIYEEVR